MPWVSADFFVGNLISYRIPDFSDRYAKTSPFPGPSAIKLALVAVTIQRRSKEKGKELFNTVKRAKVKIRPPKVISISDSLIKRLKKKKNDHVFQSSFGIRGYAHYSGPFVIYLKVGKKIRNIKYALKSIRYFGSSDSLVTCYRVGENSPPDSAIEAKSKIEIKPGSEIFPVKDINPHAGFENIDVYNPKGAEFNFCNNCGEKFDYTSRIPRKTRCNKCNKKTVKRESAMIMKYFALPIEEKREGKNWIIYKLRSRN